MDVFAEHGVAGIVGLIFNALFGTDAVLGLDGVNTGSTNDTTNTPVGGWIIHNYRQLYIQIAYIVAASAYTFVVSAIIAYVINLIPGLHLRASEEAELLGMDDDQIGEFAYDYVEVRRDYLAWTPHKHIQNEEGHGVPRAHLYGIGEHSDMVSLPSHRPSVSRPPLATHSSQSDSRVSGDEVKVTAPPPVQQNHTIPAVPVEVEKQQN